MTLFFCISIRCKHGCLPFDQKFRNFRNGDKWKVPRKSSRKYGNCFISESEPFNQKSRKFWDKSQMERKFPGKNFRKFGYTSRGCPLLRNLYKFLIFFPALASSFGRDHSELDISCKDDAHSIKRNTLEPFYLYVDKY